MIKQEISTFPLLCEMTDRQVLVDLFKSNPGNTIGKSWQVDDPDSDISTWRGVSVDDNGRIIKLDLSGCNEEGNSLFNLTVIPRSIGNLIQLTELYLYINKITEIPAEIGNLVNLTGLLLHNNKLIQIPREIAYLTKLRWLYLSSNELISIPEEIGKLTQLTILSLAYNQLNTIPAEIGKLSKLKHLYLYENNLVTIPQKICDLADTSIKIVKDSGVPLLRKI
ncbi:leucine-rich repeat domain-containing protein [Flavobacterium sp. W22_SRS_FK3]|uniref:leucine-rich repeat domain-containing protein n=1 Tax=Flavobacterium sp. W22_SRS_FK3 TaxID=3240275 RepID=UPI003F8F8068